MNTEDFLKALDGALQRRVDYYSEQAPDAAFAVMLALNEVKRAIDEARAAVIQQEGSTK